MIRSAIALLSLSLFAGAAFAATDVPLGHFTNIQLRGGGHAILHAGPAQRVTLIKGSTQYTSFKVEGDRLLIEACPHDCPHVYELEIEIVSPHVEALGVEGGGHIEAQGAFPHQASLSAAAVGGGSVDARVIPLDEANAAVSGGGRVRVAPAHDLHAAVTGGGSITYSGNPRVTKAVVGGGSVTHE